ncbi:ABC transporter permease [Arthrobacter humicola]|jgi:NitT/TauT family transport system permease protein|uniref:ABC transporter permease n=1 Tax=Arthrobacter humicola TaxID=409291 RepID=A0ABP5KMI1_9MICC
MTSPTISAPPAARGQELSAENEAGLLAGARRSRRNAGYKVWALRAVIVAVWLGSWELTATYLIDPFFYSKPSLIWDRLIQWFASGTQFGSVWENIGYTVLEATAGFAIGTVAGIVLGVLLGRSHYMAEVFSPFIKAANAVPRIVLAALFIIWFGFGISSKIATVVVLVFFAVFFNAFTGAREVDGNVVNNARILGAGKRKILTSIVLPSATTWILSSLHTAFGFALIGAIVGEYAGAKHGMGMLIANAQGTFDSAGIYAGMIIVTVVALLAESVITTAENKLLKWRPSQAQTQIKGI